MHALALLLLLTVDGRVLFDADPLPGATVTIVDSSGAKQTALTDIDGHYRFTNVAPGKYDIQAEMSGLKMRKRRDTTIYMKAVQDGTIGAILAAPVLPDGPHYTFTVRGFGKAMDLAPGVH
jgi:protocatechuate 3,4-dioxygenase beta subunit